MQEATSDEKNKSQGESITEESLAGPSRFRNVKEAEMTILNMKQIIE